MGLFSALRTSVSGMNAQSSYLNTIGDNIANSGTTGYKQASLEFGTVLGQQTPGSYESGGVLAQARYNITQQGTLTATTSNNDLAIKGGGFFVVGQAGTSGTFLTRAGSFGTDQDGNLTTASGYQLMGHPMVAGKATSAWVPINVSTNRTSTPAATTKGTIVGNLPSSDATGVTRSSTITAYDAVGNKSVVTLDYTKTSATEWSVTATPAGGTATALGTLTFDAGTGAIQTPASLTMTLGASSVALDFGGMKQIASDFGAQATLDGAGASKLSTFNIGTDGTVTAVYADGTKSALYQIPIATVTSPDNLTALSGNVYQQSNTSGVINYSTAGTGAAGLIEAGNLEASTVDIATELTNMIVAQRAYEANTKVLQAASDLLAKLDQIQTG